MQTKTIVFSLIPLIAFVGLLESGARLWATADPQLITSPLPEEEGGLFREDPLLFWSVAPDLDTEYYGKVVRTNSLGLRSREVREKLEGEFRILSLGESTTFGIGVANGETYSDYLEHNLNSADPSRSYFVLNAGTPAHSSFQFLSYLVNRSLALEPDMLLLYSELNDYLPSSIRDSSNNEIGVAMSDRELFAARSSAVRRWLEKYSVFYRAMSYRRARASIAAFQVESVVNPLTTIGLPNIGLDPRLREQSSATDAPSPSRIIEGMLPSRVSPEERRENLRSIVRFCDEHGIGLLIIHPSYRDSRWHDCLLTRFCARKKVPMIEAQQFLHPPDAPLDEMYFDDFHPSREGHERLGRGLAERILQEVARQSKNSLRIP